MKKLQSPWFCIYRRIVYGTDRHEIAIQENSRMWTLRCRFYFGVLVAVIMVLRKKKTFLKRDYERLDGTIEMIKKTLKAGLIDDLEPYIILGIRCGELAGSFWQIWSWIKKQLLPDFYMMLAFRKYHPSTDISMW